MRTHGPRPGLCRPELPDPGTRRRGGIPQGPVLRARRRLRLRGFGADRLPRHAEPSPGSRDLRQLRVQARPLRGLGAPRRGHLLVAGEAQTYDGPWAVPDALRKLNGVVRYSQGTALDASPSPAWPTGEVERHQPDPGTGGRGGDHGPLRHPRPTDGGDTGRFSLSGRWSRSDAGGVTRASRLRDPLPDEPLERLHVLPQRPRERRPVPPARQPRARRWRGLAGVPRRPVRACPGNEIGFQTRTDDIRSGSSTRPRAQYRSTVAGRPGAGGERGPLRREPVRWTDWFRTSVGIRADGYSAEVRSDTPGQFRQGPGRDRQPEARRGVRAVARDRAVRELRRRLPLERRPRRHRDGRSGEPALHTIARSPFLVPSTGAEIGLRNRSITGLETSLALFQLDFASENLFQGDTGTTEPSRPTRRFGIEWSNH